MTSRSLRGAPSKPPPGSFCVVKISANNSGSQNSSNANWIFLMSWRRSRPPKNHGSSLETLIRYRPGHNIKELFDIGWGLLKYWHIHLITNDNNYIILFQITIVASHVWVSFHTNDLQWGRSDVSVSRDPIFLCRLNYRLRNETILYPIYGILVGKWWDGFMINKVVQLTNYVPVW